MCASNWLDIWILDHISTEVLLVKQWHRDIETFDNVTISQTDSRKKYDKEFRFKEASRHVSNKVNQLQLISLCVFV